MDPQNFGAGRTPFKDKTNTPERGGQNASNSGPRLVDAMERKREGDRARFVAMTAEQRNERNKKRRELTVEQRDEINKKRCESYNRKKGQPLICGTSNDTQVEVPKENMDPANHGDWLHANISDQSQSIPDSKIDVSDDLGSERHKKSEGFLCWERTDELPWE